MSAREDRLQTISTWVRFGLALLLMALAAFGFGAVMLLLLPSRVLRVRLGNLFGKTVSRLIMRITGCPVTVEGSEHLNPARPAIYVSNHTSALDIFVCSWLAPWGTVGVAKREIVYYPFFGQLYLLSGHLRIDRGQTEAAKASMKRLGDLVQQKRLSIFLWPEGTRSRDGRLQPFKKGMAHLALQTGLPIVPLVVRGAHKAWVKNSLKLARVPIHVQVLPAIDTSHWSTRDLERCTRQVHDAFVDHLPPEQHPAEESTQQIVRA